MAFPKSTRQLVELIAAMQTPQDVAQVKKLTWYRLHWPELHNALFDRLTTLLQKAYGEFCTSVSEEPTLSQQEFSEFSESVNGSKKDTDAEPLSSTASRGYIQQNGIRYDLNEWISFREYIQRHELKSTSVLNNWISRGIIPANCVVEIAVLNDLKLIHDHTYQPGTQTKE